MEGSASNAPGGALSRLAFALATGLGSGYSRFAPGTAGSAVGLLLFLPLREAAWPTQLGATLALSLLGIAAAHHVARRVGIEDPSIVVVDELAGMWLTLVGLPFSWPLAACAFVAFRAMDVLKPWPARQLEQLPGGLGIVADDLMAAVYAHLLLRVGLRALGLDG